MACRVAALWHPFEFTAHDASLRFGAYGGHERTSADRYPFQSVEIDPHVWSGRASQDDALLRAWSFGELPRVPDYLRQLIGSMPEGLKTDIAPNREREVIKDLEDADQEEMDVLFEPALDGNYDIGALKASSPAFAKLYENPGSDCSDNRFQAARHLMREWPDMLAPALAAFFCSWPEGAGTFVDGKSETGEYDNRQVAREWLKNRALSKPSDGSAFELLKKVRGLGVLWSKWI